MTKGSCLCGSVGFEVAGELSPLSHCHCSMCRKAHGSAFATYGGAPGFAFRFTRGAEAIAHYESSPGFFRSFCRRCSSVVPMSFGDGDSARWIVPAGAFDDDPGTRPTCHYYAASAAPWYTIADDLEQLPTAPTALGRTPVERTPPAAAVTAGAVRGSCLCGRHAFEVAEPGGAIVFCHCSRCRKARSAAHAANWFAPSAAFTFTRGGDDLVVYQVPEAERFGTSSCATCGSNLPRFRPEAQLVGIPAGTLDDDPGARPALHIYCDFKAPWFEISDALRQLAAAPPSDG